MRTFAKKHSHAFLLV